MPVKANKNDHPPFSYVFNLDIQLLAKYGVILDIRKQVDTQLLNRHGLLQLRHGQWPFSCLSHPDKLAPGCEYGEARAVVCSSPAPAPPPCYAAVPRPALSRYRDSRAVSGGRYQPGICILTSTLTTYRVMGCYGIICSYFLIISTQF